LEKGWAGVGCFHQGNIFLPTSPRAPRIWFVHQKFYQEHRTRNHTYTDAFLDYNVLYTNLLEECQGEVYSIFYQTAQATSQHLQQN